MAMKNIFTLMFLCLLTIGNIFSQCCPYMDSIKIIPSNPTPMDSIKIITKTTTPSRGSRVYYTINLQADTFHIVGCFWYGNLTQPRSFRDTSNIGRLPVGIYKVNYIAYSSIFPTSCVAEDTNSKSMSFQVTWKSDFETMNSDNSFFIVYPNPADNQFHFQNNSGYSVRFILYNSLGAKIMDETLGGNSGAVDLTPYSNGIYYYKVSDDVHLIANGKMIKQ